jgi:selenocysteine lyase/cysteine desulfurase
MEVRAVNRNWKNNRSICPISLKRHSKYCGIAGLQAGIRWLSGRGIEEIRAYKKGLFQSLLEGLKELPGSLSMVCKMWKNRRPSCHLQLPAGGFLMWD